MSDSDKAKYNKQSNEWVQDLRKRKTGLLLPLVFLFVFFPVGAFSFDQKTKYVFSSNYPLVPVEADIIIVTSSLCHCFISPRPYPLTRKKNTSLSFVALVFFCFFFLACPSSHFAVSPNSPYPALRALKGTQVPDGSL